MDSQELLGMRIAATGKWLTLLLLTAVYAVSYIDRQLLLILAEPIKRELRLSDTQVGLLGGFSFALFYTLAGIPIAWLADRTNRVRIIAAACALWSLFTASCGLAGSFIQLAAARMGVGIGEAGGTAPSFSILSDHFRSEERARAVAMFTLGSPIGVLVGSAAGAAIAEAHGWRVAFFALGLPGLVLAALVVLIVKEPLRGGSDIAAKQGDAMLSLPATMRDYFSNRSVTLMTFSSGATAFVTLGVSNWLPAFLMRSKGMTMHEIALYFSVVASASVFCGIGLSGLVSDWAAKRSQRAYALVPAIAMTLALPFLAGSILASDWRLSLALIAIPLAVLSGQVAPALAFVHNSVPAMRRASASAIFLLILNIMGIGCGPLFVGAVSDLAGRAGSEDSLRVALLAMCAVLPVAILLLVITSRTIRTSPAMT